MPGSIDLIAKKTLVTLHDFIDRLTKADNLTPEQLTEAHMASTALGYQIARMDYPADVTAALLAQERLLAERICSDAPPPRTRRWSTMWGKEVGTELCGAIEARDPSNNPEILDEIRNWLVAFHSHMDPVVSAGTRSTYAGGRGDQDTASVEGLAELDARSLEAWLHSTGNAAVGTRVTAMRRLMGGYSKTTFIADIAEGKNVHRIVIRQDSPGLPTGSSVISEYPVLAEMARLGVPVPAPLWLEPGDLIGGGAFMGVAFAPGQAANLAIPKNGVTSEKWARSAAEVLAHLHSRTSLPGEDLRASIGMEIDALEAMMLERERSPHPGLLIGINWLRRHIDMLKGRPACRIHGDFGFHNIMIDNDGVSALLDWEFSRIGDPVEDLASIRPFMEQINAWTAFAESYGAQCNAHIDPIADSYFNVWREVRNMTACLGSLNSLLIPGVMAVPLTVAGSIYIPKYEIAILDAIADAEALDV